MRGQFSSYLAKPQRPFSRGNRQSLAIVMLFCLFWGWGKICCNSVWGPETACSHDVGATICHYTICLYCFLQTGSPKNQRRTWQGRVSSDRLIEEDWWDCCWQTQDGVVVSDSWDFSLPLFFFFRRKEPVRLDGLPARIARERSIPQETLSFLYSLCLWFFSRNTSVHAFQNWSSILVCAPRFPLLPLPVFQWLQLVLLDCILQRDPRGRHCYGSWVYCTRIHSDSIQQPHCLNTTAVSNVTTWWAVTPPNLATLCHPDTLKHWLQSSGSAKTCCQVRKDHYLQ